MKRALPEENGKASLGLLEKQRGWKLKKKLRYFLDYYFFRTAAGIGAILLLAFLCWHFWKPEPKTVLYVSVLDEALDQEGALKLQTMLEERYGADGRQKKLFLDDSFYTRDGGISKLQIYLTTNQVDVVIAGEDTFTTLAGFGFFQALEPIFGEEAAASYLYAPGYLETEEISFEDMETGKGPVKAYGLRLPQQGLYSQIKTVQDKPVIGLCDGAPNEENAVDFMELLMEKN